MNQPQFHYSVTYRTKGDRIYIIEEDNQRRYPNYKNGRTLEKNIGSIFDDFLSENDIQLIRAVNGIESYHLPEMPLFGK